MMNNCCITLGMAEPFSADCCTDRNTSVCTSDYIIVLTLVNTFVKTAVNTVILTFVLGFVLAIGGRAPQD
jgi:amino acid permease